MKAVILAAGCSTRLYPLTLDTPKCLLSLGKKKILDYALDNLKRAGISNIILVTGYLNDKIADYVTSDTEIIYNPRYADTNNIYSLWSAGSEFGTDDMLILYSDLLFHMKILNNILKRDGDIVLAVDEKVNEETERVKIKNGKITYIGKNIETPESAGIFLGLAKISKNAGKAVLKKLEEYISRGETSGYFTAVLNDLISEGQKVFFSRATDLPWIEIDTKEDLKRAKEIARQL